MELYKYSSVTELHLRIHSEINRIKSKDPMAPVVLVVDNPLQGLLLRRQLVDSSHLRGLANIQVKSIDEIIRDLSFEYADDPIVQPSPSVLDAASYAAMVSHKSLGTGDSDALTTAIGIASVYKSLRFCTDNQLKTLLQSSELSNTQRAVIEAVLEARGILESKLSISNYSAALEKLVSRIPTNAGSNAIYFVLTETLPVLTEKLFTKLSNVVHFGVEVNEVKIKSAAKYISAPDPQTEAALAVSQVAELVSQGVHPFDIAIGYSSKDQYSKLVAASLDDASISWHGAVSTVAQSSRLYRGFDLILQMLESRTSTSSGATRPLLMRLLESGNFAVDGQLLDADLCRKFVRDKEIYGDSINWLEIVMDLPSLGNKHEEKAAEELRALLRSLRKSLTQISSASTWTDFGRELYTVIDDFYITGNEDNLADAELEVIALFKSLLLQELPELDALKPESSAGLGPSGSTIRTFIDRKIGQKNVRTGTLSAGVHLSGLEELRVLNFKRVILVGATEGFLPQSFVESNFLTDSMLAQLGELGKGAVPTLEKTNLQAANLAAVLKDAQPIIMRSRSAMIGKLDDVASRFLDSQAEYFGNEIKVASFDDLLKSSNTFPVVSRRITNLITNQKTDFTESQSRIKNALDIFRAPAGKKYFGNVRGFQPHESIDDGYLSASAIETFIACQYRFFVTKTLGIYTAEREDTLGSWRASDFGNLIHNSMEAFLNHLSENGTLPDGQNSFSQQNVDEYFNEFLEKELKLFYAKGHDVWRAGFESHLKRVKANLRNFFETEFIQLRSEARLAVHASEFPFGKDTANKVEVKTPSGKSVQLSGRIDRVDLSEDGKSAGVIDFKSGKLDLPKILNELGKVRTSGQYKQQSHREKVQDLVYTLAVKQVIPPVDVVKVNFAYIANGSSTEYVFAAYADNPNENFNPEEQLGALVEDIIDAEKLGIYKITHSGKITEYTHCDVCERLGWVAEQLSLEFKKENPVETGGENA